MVAATLRSLSSNPNPFLSLSSSNLKVHQEVRLFCLCLRINKDVLVFYIVRRKGVNELHWDFFTCVLVLSVIITLPAKFNRCKIVN